MYVVLIAILTLGNGTPAIQAESVQTISEERLGVVISVCFIGQDIGNAVGPIFASSMVGVAGYESMFLMYAMILVVGLVLYFINNQYKSRKVI
ncbi:MAG: MFS transporter [Erysipelotrichaceae bacterium]|nr:MFS transporter [Erysipelotrichaceae bacterium]